jgi:hypothetical protein
VGLTEWATVMAPGGHPVLTEFFSVALLPTFVVGHLVDASFGPKSSASVQTDYEPISNLIILYQQLLRSSASLEGYNRCNILFRHL